MKRRAKYLDNFKNFYEAIEKDIAAYKKYRLTKKTFFSTIVRAAYIKSFEFNLKVSRSRDSETSYFQMATLRSLCEDLIAINYLLSLSASERNEYTDFLMTYDL